MEFLSYSRSNVRETLKSQILQDQICRWIMELEVRVHQTGFILLISVHWLSAGLRDHSLYQMDFHNTSLAVLITTRTEVLGLLNFSNLSKTLLTIMKVGIWTILIIYFPFGPLRFWKSEFIYSSKACLSTCLLAYILVNWQKY